MNPFPTFTGPITDVTDDTVTLPNSVTAQTDFGAKNGFYQYIVLVRGGYFEGNWWPILASANGVLSLGARGDPLSLFLNPGDTVEVRRLNTVGEIFGDRIHSATILLDQFNTIFRVEGGAGRNGYYLLQGKSAIGPIESSTLTLLPGQPVLFYGVPKESTWPALGQVHMGPFTHYLASGENLVASVFPQSQLLSVSGILESGWAGDSDGIADPAQESLIRTFKDGVFADTIIWHDGSAFDPGWYVNGTVNHSFALQNGRGYIFHINSPTGEFRWNQLPSW
jgi:hypothetical protein